jgi:hypothetical protein
LLVQLELFCSRNLVLDRLLIVRSPAIRAVALFVCDLQTVVAELTYLVAAGTGSEVLVGEVEFFDAKGASSTVSEEDRETFENHLPTLLVVIDHGVL